ncbi:MAG TPA: tripartite tricarboxylate transporter substrate binding protein [Candidatus Sphingobacterium stercoripullorum]|nr:tripartite tricarboxylate transporter substrate binding protein [Candidatus Sphingobacterium stercoripullorum]
MSLFNHLVLAIGGVLLGFGATAHAAEIDNYPDRPIKTVVAFSAGGGIDILARTIGEELGKDLDTSVVVENKPGGSGNIGTAYAARAKPDGYTQLMSVNTMIMTPSFMGDVGFDPIDDFEPVTQVAMGYLALVARPDFEGSTVQEAIDLAQQSPSELNYGSPGPGTPHHLAMELLRQEADFDAVHVPYKGSAELVRGVLAGQVDFAFLPVHQALELSRADKLIMLSAGGANRTEVTPDVPSLAEATGIEGIDVDMWYGLFLPKGTPPEIIEKLNSEVGKILEKEEVIESLKAVGLAPVSSTPKELADLTQADLERWAQVIETAGIRPNS